MKRHASITGRLYRKRRVAEARSREIGKLIFDCFFFGKRMPHWAIPKQVRRQSSGNPG